MAERFTIMFDTHGAAFEEEPFTEVSRILRQLADDWEDGHLLGSHNPIRDANGNTCGSIAITKTR